MKTWRINLYVFGHYDSRGGTVGVRVDQYEGKLKEAKERYNRWMGWSEEERKHTKAGLGRMADNEIADMIYPQGPAEEDYMWPAEMEINGEIKLEDDLEWSEQWWVITEDRSPEEQIEKWGKVRLKLTKRPENWEELPALDERGDYSSDRWEGAGEVMYGFLDDEDDSRRIIHPRWDDDAWGFVII